MKLLALSLILIFLPNCGVLTPVKDGGVDHILTPLVPDRTLAKQSPAIAIKRPSLPSYLDRQQLVTRSEGALMIRKLDIWAEPLDAGISRVMGSNLSRLTGSLNIQPVENFTTLDYTKLLEIRIAQFEPDTAHQMILQGTWKLESVTGRANGTRFFHITIPISPTPNSMSANVAAMDQALDQLARKIVKEL
jgi:uncharacterized protein